ncbi:hypothetical protein BD311DRAFT_94547 [Dichomitus squalens]|uniref:F-box domain-containing protein n=1 Tax=Dichomitus squalens TaxID=114155 RepID=A0A4Q9MBY9_9APHY|nr:hypothetical protein BD311DRAFT_94547 [Dichomitus squalens]
MSWTDFKPFRPSLPTETEENIIDLLWDDVHALRSCSLTCRAWLPRSRLHLLYAIILRNREHLIALQDILEKYPARRLLVHSVTTAPKPRKSSPRSLIEVFLLALLMQLSNLRCWKISQTTTKVIKRREALSFHRTTLTRLRYSSIDELHLTSIRLASCTEFIRLILALPRLRKLYCDDLHLAAVGTGLDSLKDIASDRLTNLSILEVGCRLALPE